MFRESTQSWQSLQPMAACLSSLLSAIPAPGRWQSTLVSGLPLQMPGIRIWQGRPRASLRRFMAVPNWALSGPAAQEALGKPCMARYGVHPVIRHLGRV